jgi:hypothetical protein
VGILIFRLLGSGEEYVSPKTIILGLQRSTEAPMSYSKHRYRVLFVALGGLVLAAFGALYFSRSTHCVLYYYGASPGEVPQGIAIALLNPLRNRKDEANAEWLIRDLRTGKCEEISRQRLGTDPTRICQVMHGNSKASLIWLDPESDTIRGGTRKLIYDLPDKKARLIVCFGADEPGWGVKTASVVR